MLDTHVVLWWLADDPRLSDRARVPILESPGAFVSAASTWEVAIKRAFGKLQIDLPNGASFPSYCRDQASTSHTPTHGR